MPKHEQMTIEQNDSYDTGRYGLLGYSSLNIGDEIQSIAAERFLPRVDQIIHREQVGDFKSKYRTKLILNAWWMWRPNKFPPSSKIDPLLISMFFRNGARHLFSKEAKKYLQRHGPVGARDLDTREFLKGEGIDAYFSGCLTLTLKRNHETPRGDFILAVDVPDAVLERLREISGRRIVSLSPILTPVLNQHERYNLARTFLYVIARAHCVITTRLHASLPALALQTPVLRVIPDEDTNDVEARFSGYEDCLHSVRETDVATLHEAYNFDQPPPNPTNYLALREQLIETASAFTGTVKDEPSYQHIDDFEALTGLMADLRHTKSSMVRAFWWIGIRSLRKLLFQRIILRKDRHSLKVR